MEKHTGIPKYFPENVTLVVSLNISHVKYLKVVCIYLYVCFVNSYGYGKKLKSYSETNFPMLIIDINFNIILKFEEY